MCSVHLPPTFCSSAHRITVQLRLCTLQHRAPHGTGSFYLEEYPIPEPHRILDAFHIYLTPDANVGQIFETLRRALESLSYTHGRCSLNFRRDQQAVRLPHIDNEDLIIKTSRVYWEVIWDELISCTTESTRGFKCDSENVARASGGCVVGRIYIYSILYYIYIERTDSIHLPHDWPAPLGVSGKRKLPRVTTIGGHNTKKKMLGGCTMGA